MTKLEVYSDTKSVILGITSNFVQYIAGWRKDSKKSTKSIGVGECIYLFWFYAAQNK